MIATRELASVSRFAEAGSVIGPMPEIVAAATGCPLVRVLPDWHVSRARLHAITLGGREAPARVRVFRDFIRSELTELRANGKAAGSCSRCRATTGATPPWITPTIADSPATGQINQTCTETFALRETSTT